MPKKIAPYAELLLTEKYYPSVSVIMSIDIKVNPKKEIDQHLKRLLKNCIQELSKTYPQEITDPVVDKLKYVFQNLDYANIKKSVAIFVSPIFEKIFYLDMPLEERIVIDDSFEIRDLIYSKNNLHKYLLIVLSSKSAVIYLGNSHSMVVIDKIKAVDLPEMNHDLPEKVANFTDSTKIKENLLDKFLQNIDKHITQILQNFNLPLFIMGTIKTNGHFNRLTKHKKFIAHYIYGNYETKVETELLDIVAPYVNEWNKTKKDDLLKTIDDAIGRKKIAIGIKEVWKCATEKKGKHLIVEKNYVYPARQSAKKDVIFGQGTFVHNQLFIHDAVDDIIEKIIGCGGTIEFVDEGLLANYQKIVLLQYY